MSVKKPTKQSPEKASLNRPPVVVVLGHVDHGKTTLLDYIRKTEVAAREYGGITQSIGAYQAAGITFVDTPGHEVFSAMRSRGAAVADIAVLVVAADDSVMPQTVEAIKIIKEAKIPFVVAINKVDLPEANVDKVVKDLGRHEVQVENYGGQVPWVKISAKTGAGVKELLDLISLLAEMAEIKADSQGPAEFVVIEAKMDKNRGPVATVVVRSGTLSVGDKIDLGGESKIRALVDFQGQMIKTATAGMPVEILGLKTVPKIGQGSKKAVEGGLTVILKTDNFGSLEAIEKKLPENVNLIAQSTGEISEADILLAKSTHAIILGFNVKVASSATKLAEVDKVLVRTYKIIYELLDELADAAAGMLAPTETEEILGKGKIIAEFPFEKMKICGIKVTEGRVAKGDLIKVKSQKSKVKSVRVGKDEVTKVEAGKECGVLLDPQVDFKIGDDIMAYRLA